MYHSPLISFTSGIIDLPDMNLAQNLSLVYPDLMVSNILLSEDINSVVFTEFVVFWASHSFHEDISSGSESVTSEPSGDS